MTRALFQHDESNPYELEIWITTKIDVEMVSWSKFLTVNTGLDIGTNIDGSFFIDEEKKVAMGFNVDYPTTFSIIGENGYLRNWDLGIHADPYVRQDVCFYVLSLVQIKKPVIWLEVEVEAIQTMRFKD